MPYSAENTVPECKYPGLWTYDLGLAFKSSLTMRKIKLIQDWSRCTKIIKLKFITELNDEVARFPAYNRDMGF